MSVRDVDDLQSRVAGVSGIDERGDSGRHGWSFESGPGKHDRQVTGSGDGLRRAEPVIPVRRCGQHGVSCRHAAQPVRRCAQPVGDQQPAAGEEPQRDPIRIDPRVGPRQLDGLGDIAGCHRIAAEVVQPVVDSDTDHAAGRAERSVPLEDGPVPGCRPLLGWNRPSVHEDHRRSGSRRLVGQVQVDPAVALRLPGPGVEDKRLHMRGKLHPERLCKPASCRRRLPGPSSADPQPLRHPRAPRQR